MLWCKYSYILQLYVTWLAYFICEVEQSIACLISSFIILTKIWRHLFTAYSILFTVVLIIDFE